MRLIDNALVLMRQKLELKEITLHDERTPNLPAVNMPVSRIMQTLLNPIKNSLRAMEGLENGVLTLRTGTAGDRVFVDIEDNGMGIPKAFLPRVFEPFATVGAPQKNTLGAGMGLGLSLVRRAVEAGGGTIAIESEEGHGTRIHITFPAVMESPETS